MTNLFGRSAVESYRRSSTLRGLASVMDLTGNTTRQHHFYASPAEADAAALCDDWQQVGLSLQQAVEDYQPRR